MLTKRTPIYPSLSEPPQLLVVVDTEEEFDWSLPPDNTATSVSSMEKIYLTQDICEQFQLAPAYMVDYPIASQEQGYKPLQNYLAKGTCEIGAHLHPWVNPPIDEELIISNMYPGNLPIELERSKLKILQKKIQQTFGHTPIAYKAGRYGFGPNTQTILDELGFKIDLSFCPPMDHSHDGGPDYSREKSSPFWFGNNNDMLEIPVSGAFVGNAGKYSRNLYNVGNKFEKLKVPGILSRLGIVDRLILSPEGFTSDEHIKITKFLFNQGVRTFTWSYHSPTAVPGHTEYVRNNKDLQNFLDSFKRYFDFFFNELGGKPTTPSKLYRQLESKR